MKYKVYKVAKQLKLQTDTILEFVKNDLKVETKKGIHTSLDEKQYLDVLKKFDLNAYNKQIGKDDSISGSNYAKTAPETRKIDMNDALNEILNAPESTPAVEEKRERDKGRRSVRKIKKSVDQDSLLEKSESKPSKSSSKSDVDKKKNLKPKSEKRSVSKDKESKKFTKESKESQIIEPVLTPEEVTAAIAKKGKKHKDSEFKKKGDSLKEDMPKASKLKKKRLKKVVAEEPEIMTTKKRKKKKTVDKEAVKDSVKQTLKKMENDSAKSFKKRKKKKTTDDGSEIEVEVNIINVVEFMSTQELANKMGVDVTSIIAKFFGLGMMVTINQRLDKDQIELICAEYDFDCEFETEYNDDVMDQVEEVDKEEDLSPRPPIVTIMGHVDHGKTSLLDYIRKTHVVEGESGGITQHIGAYEAIYNDKAITFLDTPGHEAFTAMRARGAKVTDICVVVIAADDSIMPQTIEAIDHSKVAGVPIIIAINKMDKPAADPNRIKADLSGKNVVVEDLGGSVQCIEISAKSGMGIDDLLDSILVEAEMLELKANENAKARGVVIESRLDKGLGSIATVLVQRGTLKIGDIFVCGQFSGRVRSLLNERKEKVKSAGPAIPAVVLGINGTPKAGDILVVVDSEREAKDIASKRQQLNRAQSQHQVKIMSLDHISQQIKKGEVRELNIIVKGDVDGSVEAVSDSIMKLSNDEVAVRVVHRGVGAITESDILLAQASNAILLGFNIRPNLKARELSEKENVEIRLYSIIYDLIADVKQALEGLLAPDIEEKVVGTVEVRTTFKVPKIGTIAGCYVLSGKIKKSSLVKLVRDNIVIYTAKVSSLRRHKDDVKEVVKGFECGVGIEKFNDLKDGDIIEVYEEEEVKRTLE
ncbi:MAG: translation initiation factor IF-2 [Candidatus Cloacimonadota bacterium]|nr:MAG: translation initiation factor IF-2 [Candidatus Cloacimonadota bacterium]PIE77488.1 MAG: translation initiation factor IF-2 [Candidatus Delongbacteria bacterium]